MSATIMKKSRLVGAAVFVAIWVQADVQFAPIFNKGAVLQCEMPVNVWGTADSGSAVTVIFGGQQKKAVASADGCWHVQLDPMTPSSEARTLACLSASGGSVVSNVTVGEVWLATGQSNMVVPLRFTTGGAQRLKQTRPDIRFSVVPKQEGLPSRPFTSEHLAWKTFAPPANEAIAGVAFYFAEKLQEETGREIGILQCSYGGTPAEAWTPGWALSEKPELKYLADAILKGLASKRAEEWQEDVRRYKESTLARNEWRKTRKGPAPRACPMPGPENPWFQNAPTVLFENMLRPLIPYTARGVIWYQGEGNAGKPDEYRVLFPAMIEAWRSLWKRPDWPFFFVQLSAYDNPNDWPALRAAQAFTRDTVPHTGMALALDCGEKENIHPKAKQPVGERLARLALEQVYGKKCVSRGPEFEMAESKAGRILVTFRHVESGLRTGDGKPEAPGFEVADADGTFQPARARIVSDRVVELACDAVPSPVAVRYAWSNWMEPPVTLQNSAGLPAEPFQMLHPVRGLAAEQVDPRVRTFITPARVVWVSETCEQASVSNAAILLAPRHGQVPEGAFLAGSGCRLENKGAPASVLVDFGRELHGGVQLASGGPSGKDLKVRIRFGESVAESMAELGERGAGNDCAIRDGVIDLPWLGTREIGNSGFRFVRVDLVSKGVLSLESLRAVSLMRPMPYLGAFKSSDERLNQIWATAARTLHLCCQEYIWDGIKRDRLVWMGDMHPEVMSLMAVFGRQELLPDSLNYMRKTTPADLWMNGMPSYTLWWIRCQHDWYRYTGDLAYLKAHHAYLKAVFVNLAKHISAENRCALPSGFLDWPTQHNRKAVDAGMQALMLMTFEDGARLAAALKDAELEAQCKAGAARLCLYKPAPEGSKQAAALLALSGLSDARTINEQVLSQNGVQGVSTFYGYYMLEAMAKAGDVQRGLDTVRTYWGAMLDMGATSFWEDFNVAWTNNAFRIDELPVAGKKDIHGDYGEFCYKGFRHSLCHGWSSGPAAWLSGHVLGIQVADVGCTTVRVKPYLGDLQWAEGSFPTPKGVIKVRHEKQADGSIKSAISAPDGVRVVRE